MSTGIYTLTDYVCLMVLNTFSFIVGGNQSTQSKPHNVVRVEIRTHNITGCIGSLKSHYHTITATAAPKQIIRIYHNNPHQIHNTMSHSEVQF